MGVVGLVSLQSCPTLCDPRDGSPPGSLVPGILQARTLQWVAITFVTSAYFHSVNPPSWPVSSYQHDVTEHGLGKRCAQSALSNQPEPAQHTSADVHSVLSSDLRVVRPRGRIFRQ